ncbi:hypothetical protein [uncultured Nocardioides sp.]|uniref:hypothetical protein n=1 Tax=uncultured Nocardioides sp. TaxID=198441 RepID=UPI002611B7F4|nr:hypothetical protein [uncultured Nocardioides sp.]
MTHTEQWWTDHASDPVLRCTASYRRNGLRCRREAHPGTNVCGHHGALVPAVRAKAATRIGMSVDDVVQRLLAMLDDPSVQARDRVKVLHDLLDRGGLGAANKLLVGVTDVDPVQQLFHDLLADPEAFATPQALLPAQAPDVTQARLDAEAEGRDYEDVLAERGGIVDAEVVEDQPTPAQVAAAAGQPKTAPVPTPPHIRRALDLLL